MNRAVKVPLRPLEFDVRASFRLNMNEGGKDVKDGLERLKNTGQLSTLLKLVGKAHHDLVP